MKREPLVTRATLVAIATAMIALGQAVELKEGEWF